MRWHFYPPTNWWESWGLGALWGAPSSSSGAFKGVRSESMAMAPEGLDPFSLLALCHLLLKSMSLAMASLLLWDSCPPSKLAPKCPI